MRQISSGAVKLLLAGVLAALGLVGFQAGAVSAAPLAQARCGVTSAYRHVDLSALPPQATQTVDLIEHGGPFRYRQDGEVWANREGRLPRCSRGYYHEYTVTTPGQSGRGARRFVVGRGGEFFYTGNHYETFELTDIHA